MTFRWASTWEPTLAIHEAVEFTELGLHGNLLSAPHDQQLALPLEDGCLPVPDGPGLGVTLNEAELARYAL